MPDCAVTNPTLERARAKGATFIGGDVFYEADRFANFGRADGETPAAFGRVGFDSGSGEFRIESTKVGAATVSDVVVRIGDPLVEALRITTDFTTQYVDGVAAAVSAAGTGRLRYNDTTKTFQNSLDGGAYTDIGGGGVSPWQTTANVTNLVVATDRVTIGSAIDNGRLFVDGISDIVQLRVQAHSTQTANVVVYETSAAAPIFQVSLAGSFIFTQGIVTSGSPTMMTVTAGAHTTLAASTEAIDADVDLARTVQFSAGALALQRAMVVRAPTYAATAATTITRASTFAITGAPVAGANVTITDAFACELGGDLFMNTNEIVGSTAAGGDLTLKATSNATGGSVFMEHNPTINILEFRGSAGGLTTVANLNDGGGITVSSGAGVTAGTDGGIITLVAGSATMGNADGGILQLNSGAGIGTGDGGDLTSLLGDGGATSGRGGDYSFTSGDGFGSGPGGFWTTVLGNGGVTSGQGGQWSCTTGNAGVGSVGAGGNFIITTGDGATVAGAGNFQYNGGTGGGRGGGFFVNCGPGGAGDVGGDVTIDAGLGGTAAAGGAVAITAGFGDGVGLGGDMTLAGGDGGITDARGGNVTLTGGTPGGTGAFGTVILSTNVAFDFNTPAQINVDQDDFALSENTVQRMSTDASRTITGFVAPPQARYLIIINVGANDLVIADQDVNSAAINRIITGTGFAVTLSANDSLVFWYDPTTARWRVIS